MERKTNLRLRIICYLAYFIFRALSSTYRIRFTNPEIITKARAQHPAGSFVFGLWHEYFFSGVACHTHMGISPMISQSQDGELISFISTKLGFEPVRGSTSRGGEEAREDLYRRVQNGLKAAFTADGPRGPRRKMKSGLVDLSRQGQMPIVPLAVSADRAWRLNRSWDHSLIPKPFAKLVVLYGEPFIIDAQAHGSAFAEAKRKAQIALDKVSIEADQFFLKA